MSMEQQQETWQIDSQGQIYDTNFEELTSMIEEGTLLPMDRVRKGNLRWIEAAKVPSLLAVFNAKEGEAPPKPVITLTKLGPTSVPGEPARRRADTAVPEPSNAPLNDAVSEVEPMCAMHEDVTAIWICGTCFSNFCKACPTSYGANVKICPYCGAMCNKIEAVEAEKAKAVSDSVAMSGGFGFGDFINALAYPFRFKVSLLLGGVIYSFFSIGAGAAGFGSIFLIGAAVMCYMLANTLTFGIMANTVENFTHGNVESDFMPAFDDFSIWDDVVHPFFLSIGVWISSFGPLILVATIALFVALNSVTNPVKSVQEDAARTVTAPLAYAEVAAKQSQEVRELLNKHNENQKRRIAEFERGEEDMYMPSGDFQSKPKSIAPEAEAYSRKQKALAEAQNKSANSAATTSDGPGTAVFDESEESAMRAEEMVQEMRKAQLESAIGKMPETQSAEQWAMIKQFAAYGVIFIMIGGLCLLWGLFYFPAACAVAGYTRSFTATLNPAVGFDTIKRLGVDYVKILLMGLVLMIMSGIVTVFFAIIFFPFNMPSVGNIPATAIGSMFSFYFWIVFSCVLGFAMYKASDRFNLQR